MSDFVRVLDTDTGHERTIREHLLPHGNYAVLDNADAVNVAGEPLPPTFAHAPTAGGYDAQTVPDLKVEIARRNEGREAEQSIPTTGNKADLISALKADDEKENDNG